MCSARRLNEVILELNQFYCNDICSEFDNEHLNFSLGGDDISRQFDFQSMPGPSRSVNSNYKYNSENKSNTEMQQHLDRLVEELEVKLSQHSLNVQHPGNDDDGKLVVETIKS